MASAAVSLWAESGSKSEQMNFLDTWQTNDDKVYCLAFLGLHYQGIGALILILLPSRKAAMIFLLIQLLLHTYKVHRK